MRTNNYLSLNNFKVNLHRQRLFFINEYYARGSNFFVRCEHVVTWGV